MDFNKAKKKLATLWLVMSGLIFVLMIILTNGQRFESKVDEAWSWLLPSILPTLSLILGVFVYESQQENKTTRVVDKFYFRITYMLSLFYLLLFLTMPLIQPATGKPLIFLMKQSGVYLGPLQGLVSASMGIFFLKKE